MAVEGLLLRQQERPREPDAAPSLLSDQVEKPRFEVFHCLMQPNFHVTPVISLRSPSLCLWANCYYAD